jgi:hypothetical protein
MIIKELILEEDNEMSGVHAISLVDQPAILSNFIYFKDEMFRTVSVGGGYIIDLNDFWKYTADPEPEIIDTSHVFCKHKAGGVFHISEIRSWDKFKDNYYGAPSGFINDSNFFAEFQGVNNTSFNIDNQLFNCRHAFRRVRDLSDIPEVKQRMFRKKIPGKINQSIEVQFSVQKESRELIGPVLIPNVMIYRKNINDTGKDGYVFFSKSTIKKIKERYGFNRKSTIMHEIDITGRLILLDSWIYPDDKSDNFNMEVPPGTWMMKYKVLDDKIWQLIKDKIVIGFSVEAFFTIN